MANSLITNIASLFWDFQGFQFRNLEVAGTDSITKTNTGALLLYAPVSVSSLLVAGGYLGGVGPISAPVTVGVAGILSPGTNQIVGTLAINGNLTLQGTVLID